MTQQLLPFYHLPYATDNAAANMARDLHLLEHFPLPGALRFRSYGWSEPAFTFGYSQHWHWIQSQLEALTSGIATSIRRPTGGGLVDHRQDWTYALVIPAIHPAHHGSAEDIYARVHRVLAEAVSASGTPATLAPSRPQGIAEGLQGFCFASPEPCDAVICGTTTKIAGAAMKRNRHGLLIQGSLEKKLVPTIQDWDAFTRFVSQAFAKIFDAVPPTPISHPDPGDPNLRALQQRFSSPQWNQRR